MYRIAIAVGEKSGDNLGANLIKSLRELDLEFEVFGICGPAMIEQGAQALHSFEKINMIGFEGLISRVLGILSFRRRFAKELIAMKPNVFVGIDAPDFNLGLERKLKAAGISTIQYVCPTIWAWRSYRIHKLSRSVSKMLTIYPFEGKLLKAYNIPYAYVGHPMVEFMETRNRDSLRSEFNLSSEDVVVAVLPGSRTMEIDRLAPIFWETMSLLSERYSNIKFITPVVSERVDVIYDRLQAQGNSNLAVQRVSFRSQDVMTVADVVLAASGTAVLEAAVLTKPVVVGYKLSTFSYLVVRLFTRARRFAILNYFGNPDLVPEFMQSQATATNFAESVARFIDSVDARSRLEQELVNIREQLRCPTNRLVAEEVAKCL